MTPPLPDRAASRPPDTTRASRPPDPTGASREPDTTNASRQLEEVALVDLLDRVLAKGVVVSGDITLSIANIDLVHVSLRALISSVRAGTEDVIEGEIVE